MSNGRVRVGRRGMTILRCGTELVVVKSKSGLICGQEGMIVRDYEVNEIADDSP